MKRILLAALPMAFVAVTACSGSDSASAAKVNGDAIDDRSFVDELKAYGDNKLYQAGSSTAVLGEDGTVKADFARAALLNEIILTLARQEVEHRGLDATAANPDTVTALVNQIYSGDASKSDVFAAFPADFQEQARKEAANFVVLQDSFAGEVSDAQVQAAYDAEPHRWGNLCASHILVATEAEAVAVKARLDAGEDFATVAKSTSTDPSAATNGGTLTNADGSCVPTQTYVKEFVDGVLAATVGQPTAPVQSQFGWHIIRVDKWEDVPLADVQAGIRGALVQEAQTKGNTALNDWLTSELKGDIWVNPRYGTFDPNTNRIIAAGGDITAPPTTAS